jgi:hypothetical protein
LVSIRISRADSRTDQWISMVATALAAMALMPVAEVDHFLRQKGLNCSQSAYSDKYTLGLPWEGIKMFRLLAVMGIMTGWLLWPHANKQA